MACPTYSGGEYALNRWAAAYHAQTYPAELRGAFMVDNSEDMPTGLHYAHVIRNQGIECQWLTKLMPALWDTMELCWAGPNGIVEHAHEGGYDFIFSVEHDVIIAPEAMQVMVDKALEYAEDGKPAVVSHEVHPRGQEGSDFHWDTLALTMLPTEPLYADRLLAKAIYEIECHIVTKRHGYPRHRTRGLFAVEHLKSPTDPIGDSRFAATSAADIYALRKIHYNDAKKAPAAPVVEAAKPAGGEVKQLHAQPGHILGSGEPVAGSAENPPAEKEAAKTTVRMRNPLPVTNDDPPINLHGARGEDELEKIILQGGRLRLNLGSGYQQIAGFVGVDFDPDVDPEVLSDVGDLSWLEDDCVDMILASHLLEHLTLQDSRKALKEWLRVLKPGGFLDVAVPDVNQVYLMWRKGQLWGDYQQLVDEVYINATAFGANQLAEAIPEMADMYGGPGHVHKQIFIHDMLFQRILEAGFVEVREVTANFLRRSAIGEVMVAARKMWYPPSPPMADQPMLAKE